MIRLRRSGTRSGKFSCCARTSLPRILSSRSAFGATADPNRAGTKTHESAGSTLRAALLLLLGRSPDTIQINTKWRAGRRIGGPPVGGACQTRRERKTSMDHGRHESGATTAQHGFVCHPALFFMAHRCLSVEIRLLFAREHFDRVAR